jgi:hypothetical protein
MQYVVYGAESSKFIILPRCWQDLFVTSLQPIRDVSGSRAHKFRKGYSPLPYPPLHNTLSSARTLLRNYVQLDKKILVVKQTECVLSHSQKCTIESRRAVCLQSHTRSRHLPRLILSGAVPLLFPVLSWHVFEPV